jgi:hypothetical protein
VLTKIQYEIEKEGCHYQDEERFPVSLDFDFRSSGCFLISSRCKVARRFPQCIVQGIMLSPREAAFPHSGVGLSVLQSKIGSCQNMPFVSGSPSLEH